MAISTFNAILSVGAADAKSFEYDTVEEWYMAKKNADTVGGERIQLQAKTNTTFSDLRKMVHQMTGLLPRDQRFKMLGMCDTSGSWEPHRDITRVADMLPRDQGSYIQVLSLSKPFSLSVSLRAQSKIYCFQCQSSTRVFELRPLLEAKGVSIDGMKFVANITSSELALKRKFDGCPWYMTESEFVDECAFVQRYVGVIGESMLGLVPAQFVDVVVSIQREHATESESAPEVASDASQCCQLRSLQPNPHAFEVPCDTLVSATLAQEAIEVLASSGWIPTIEVYQCCDAPNLEPLREFDGGEDFLKPTKLKIHQKYKISDVISEASSCRESEMSSDDSCFSDEFGELIAGSRVDGVSSFEGGTVTFYPENMLRSGADIWVKLFLSSPDKDGRIYLLTDCDSWVFTIAGSVSKEFVLRVGQSTESRSQRLKVELTDQPYAQLQKAIASRVRRPVSHIRSIQCKVDGGDGKFTDVANDFDALELESGEDIFVVLGAPTTTNNQRAERAVEIPSAKRQRVLENPSASSKTSDTKVAAKKAVVSAKSVTNVANGDQEKSSASKKSMTSANELAKPKQICIRFVDKKVVAIDVSLDDTVGSLKTKIAQKEKIPIERQRLIYAGKGLLDDAKMLRDHKITYGDTIFIVMSRPTPMAQPPAKKLTSAEVRSKVFEWIELQGDAGVNIRDICAFWKETAGVDEKDCRDAVRVLEGDGEIWTTVDDYTFAA